MIKERNVSNMNDCGNYYTLRIPDEDDNKSVIAVTTSFMGFSPNVPKSKTLVELRPTFMSIPLNEPSRWLDYMFNNDILSIEIDDDNNVQLRYCSNGISEPVEVYDKLIYYWDDGVQKTLHLTEEEFENMVITHIGDKYTKYK